jgi:hypothetical protein
MVRRTMPGSPVRLGANGLAWFRFSASIPPAGPYRSEFSAIIRFFDLDSTHPSRSDKFVKRKNWLPFVRMRPSGRKAHGQASLRQPQRPDPRRQGGRRHAAGGMVFPMRRHVIAGLIREAVRG